MIISDLTYLEAANNSDIIEGGLAIANADAYANAYGKYFAGTTAYTSTSAYSSYYYNSASSSSYSNSSAS